MKKIIYSLIALCALATGTVQASIDTLGGEFLNAGQLDYYSFSVDTAGAVNLYSSSNTPSDPTLTLWSASSLLQSPVDWTQIAFNDNTTTLSGFESGFNSKDAQVKLTLDIGTYFAQVAGQGSLFAYQFNVDTTNVVGTGAIVSNLAPAAVPLPAAVWMFGASLMGFLGFAKRKGQKSII